MALKDWKKTRKDAWRKNEYGLIIYKHNEIGYIVSISPGFGKTNIGDTFKTKSQALKFAKSYMRKH